MKYGIREICDVVFRAKTEIQIGSYKFVKGEPVFYFDTLKTSSLEGASTTVYATGGKGNARLIGWTAERTLTFNMEDALISPVSLAMLAGAGLIDNGGDADDQDIVVHTTGRFDTKKDSGGGTYSLTVDISKGKCKVDATNYPVYYGKVDDEGNIPVKLSKGTITEDGALTGPTFAKGETYFVDYYVVAKKAETSAKGSAFEVDITPDVETWNFYIEGATLWRDTNGKDHAAEVIIPNGMVQSNFTFTMAATGDPSTFNFVVDAFPGYIAGNKKNKLMAAMQVFDTLENTTAQA